MSYTITYSVHNCLTNTCIDDFKTAKEALEHCEDIARDYIKSGKLTDKNFKAYFEVNRVLDENRLIHSASLEPNDYYIEEINELDQLKAYADNYDLFE